MTTQSIDDQLELLRLKELFMSDIDIRSKMAMLICLDFSGYYMRIGSLLTDTDGLTDKECRKEQATIQKKDIRKDVCGWNMGLARRIAPIAASVTSKNLGLRARTSTDLFVYR